MGWMEKAVRSVRAKARGSVEAGRVEVGESGGVRAEGEIEDRSRMVREEMRKREARRWRPAEEGEAGDVGEAGARWQGEGGGREREGNGQWDRLRTEPEASGIDARWPWRR